MYTTTEGYKVIAFHTERNKEYRFTMLGNRRYVENELKGLGFCIHDITAATYTRLTSEELEREIEAIEDSWDKY